MWDKAWDSFRDLLTLFGQVDRLREGHRQLEEKVQGLSLTVERLSARFEQQKEAERVYRENLELKLRLELHQEFQRELAKLEKKYAKAARAQSAEPKPKKASRKRLPPPAQPADE